MKISAFRNQLGISFGVYFNYINEGYYALYKCELKLYFWRWCIYIYFIERKSILTKKC